TQLHRHRDSQGHLLHHSQSRPLSAPHVSPHCLFLGRPTSRIESIPSVLRISQLSLPAQQPSLLRRTMARISAAQSLRRSLRRSNALLPARLLSNLHNRRIPNPHRTATLNPRHLCLFGHGAHRFTLTDGAPSRLTDG